MLPSEIKSTSVLLPHKPNASIQCSYVEVSRAEGNDIQVIFLNGLMADKSLWLPVMARIVCKQLSSGSKRTALLAYDRFGQGLTESRDPQDEGREPGHGHDVADAAIDLRHLIQHLDPDRSRRLILVGNSIGCAIARLYAQENPVAGLLFLDSIIANSTFDWWPDPDAPSFDATQLPDDVSIGVLREQRAKFLTIFSPNTPNKEGLSRRNLQQLLPYSDRPLLQGDDQGPWITVLGHDFETFADEGVRVSPQ